jgi:hypothetical protein
MPKPQFRFDLAAILLASVLTALGIAPAEAGGRTGIGGEVHNRGNAAASATRAGGGAGISGDAKNASGGHRQSESPRGGGVTPTGGRGGLVPGISEA